MDSLNVKRRLSCILAADAVGYSSLMARDEEGTVRVLAAHRAVIDGIIKFHEGRIVSTAGDSVLAEFASVVEAVRCAVEIQEAIKTRNDSLAPDHKMHFRVGINLGDVVVQDKDLLGDGVNVAARLETIAEPGGICISSSVYDQITGKLDLRFQDIGDQALKNIGRPIHVYRIARGAPTPSVSTAVPPEARAKRRWKLGTAGLAGATLVSAAIAWQSGWLHPGSFGQDRAKDSVVPVSSTPPGTPPKDAAPPLPLSTNATASSTTSGSTAVQKRLSDPKDPAVSTNAAASRHQGDAMKRQIESQIAKMRNDAMSGRGTTTFSGAPGTRPPLQSGSDAQSYHSEPGAAGQGNPYRQGR